MGLFPEWTWVVGLWIGAAVGSFLNVVIYRMPRGLSLGKPTYSFCPLCKHRLGIPDLMPLLSWLIQRGRCRYCDARIPSRYFFVELTNGVIWGGLWYQQLCEGSDPAKFIAYGLAASALVAIIWIDLELHMVPEQVNAFLSLTGLAYGGWLVFAKQPGAFTNGVPSAIMGWLCGWGILFFIALAGRLAFGRVAMGEGDIKIARGIGSILFPVLTTASIGMAVALGAVLGVAQAAYNSRRRDRKQKAEGNVPVMVEGVLTARTDAGVRLRITDTTQATLAPVKGEVEFSFAEQAAYFKGAAKISAESFWSDIAVGTKLAVNGRSEDGVLLIDEIGKDQAPLTALLKAGVGYLLGFDIWGLFYVPFYKKYFGEDPFEPPADLESFDAGDSMIPFGPYLAAGAIFAAVFAPQLAQGIQNYLNWSGLGKS